MATGYTYGERTTQALKRLLQPHLGLVNDRNHSSPSDGACWFRITAATQDGSNMRWVYSMTEVYKSGVGYNAWTDVPGGLTTTKGYNGIEDQNGATGTYGVNIASTDLTGTFALKPLYTGVRVRAWPIVNTSNDVEWWFAATNQVNGACP